tara:strand:+ start:147 stop:761 length:615 start_codon:yes stop_codon:yes gene_type:complete
MKKVHIEEKKSQNFIGSYLIENDELLEEIINLFENNPSKVRHGSTTSGKDSSHKNSMDLSIYPSEIHKEEYLCIKDYALHLKKCLGLYRSEWSAYAPKDLFSLGTSSFNIQKYPPGGHFIKWHSERTSIFTSERQLAWMTYLNDQDIGGETEFLHFGIKVKPKKGLTLIWPSDWTHTHRGNKVIENKYIITGWFDFLPPENKND